MEFCQECGTRVIPQRQRNTHICPRCGQEASSHSTSESLNTPRVMPLPSAEVIDEHASNLRTLPTVNIYCDVCDQNRRAETWTITGSSDGISMITVFRCRVCGRAWREIDRG
jgi:DNA-directed RNA polymerase subunit M/transcription elongation factor TFIIS